MPVVSILGQSLTITLFVLSMMLIIDYINVLSRGTWTSDLQKKPYLQVILAAVLGIIPGCLGAYTAVSLYVHNMIGKGALVAAMIATSGDEAFFMFSVIPDTALIIHLLLFTIAIVAGLVINRFYRSKHNKQSVRHFEIHENVQEKTTLSKAILIDRIRNFSTIRLVLMISMVTAIVMVLLNFNHILEDFVQLDHHDNTHDHLHPQWISITFLVVLLLSLFIIFMVSEHFIKEHLIAHIIRKHLLRIFLWTFFTLLAIYYLSDLVDLESLISENLYLVLLIAVLVGIIPQSGPNLLFILLFASGTLPFSILLANSIVQDGHGGLPLLAESQKDFFLVKFINVLVGIAAGLILLAIGL